MRRFGIHQPQEYLLAAVGRQQVAQQQQAGWQEFADGDARAGIGEIRCAEILLLQDGGQRFALHDAHTWAAFQRRAKGKTVEQTVRLSVGMCLRHSRPQTGQNARALCRGGVWPRGDCRLARFKLRYQGAEFIARFLLP